MPTSLAQRRARENALARTYQRSPAARHDVVAELLPLARSVARAYKRGEEPLDDLIQVASLGLIKALERWDPDRGPSFHAFADPCMRGEVRRHYRDTGWAVHVPRAAQELAQKVTAAERRLLARADTTPTAADIARHLGLTESQVREGRTAAAAMRAGSLDAPVADDAAPREPGRIDPDFERAEHRATLSRIVRALPDRDRVMLAMRYGQHLPQRVIGQRLGLSQMHVSRELRRIETGLTETAAVS